MKKNIAVLPIGAGALARAFASMAAVAAHWAKVVVKASRNRREAKKLAGLDQRILADMGITSADVRDAFSGPFWEDPTALLRERAIERRMNRGISRAQRAAYPEYSTRARPPAAKARHAV